MAGVDFIIILDRDPAEYRGGETIEGSVDVRVQQACTCRAMSVGVEWLAKSRREEDRGFLPEIVFEGGALESG